MSDSSNTTPKLQGGVTGKGFVKGDPRINRKGRPKSFDALRALAQQIAHEAATKDGKPLVIEGHKVTVAEAILRTWAQSKNPQLVKSFIEIAFGKVPDKTEQIGEIILRIVRSGGADNQSEGAASETAANKE